MTLYVYRLSHYIASLSSRYSVCCWDRSFFQQNMKNKLRPKGSLSAIVQPKQEDALFSPVVIPGWQWNNWNNCGNVTLQKIKNCTDGGGKERRRRVIETEEIKQTGIHSMEIVSIVSKCVLSLVCVLSYILQQNLPTYQYSSVFNASFSWHCDQDF